MLYAPGTVIDQRFQLISVLGSGGIGMVYLARQLELDRLVALKFLNVAPGDRLEDSERLKREAIVLNKLSHANILGFYGYGIWQSFPYLVLEYIEGNSLQKLLEQQKQLAFEQVMDIAKQSASALAFAHGMGIIHRDLKPVNIMLCEREQTKAIKLIDFGLVKLLPEFGEAVQKLTKTGVTVGSINYMSPEQCTNTNVDARSDLYSLAATLQTCLTGVPLFDKENEVMTMMAHLQEDPPKLSSMHESAEPYRQELQKLLNKGLAKDPEDRYQSADELLADLYKIESGQGLAISLTYKSQVVAAGSNSGVRLKTPVWIFGTTMFICAIFFMAISYKSKTSEATTDLKSSRGIKRAPFNPDNKPLSEAQLDNSAHGEYTPLFTQGRLAQAKKKYTDAISSYKRALIEAESLYGKNSAQALAAGDSIAECAIATKNYTEAEPYLLSQLSRLKERNPRDPQCVPVLYYLALGHSNIQAKRAEAELREALEFCPRDANFPNKLDLQAQLIAEHIYAKDSNKGTSGLQQILTAMDDTPGSISAETVRNVVGVQMAICTKCLSEGKTKVAKDEVRKCFDTLSRQKLDRESTLMVAACRAALMNEHMPSESPKGVTISQWRDTLYGLHALFNASGNFHARQNIVDYALQAQDLAPYLYQELVQLQSSWYPDRKILPPVNDQLLKALEIQTDGSDDTCLKISSCLMHARDLAMKGDGAGTRKYYVAAVTAARNNKCAGTLSTAFNAPRLAGARGMPWLEAADLTKRAWDVCKDDPTQTWLTSYILVDRADLYYTAALAANQTSRQSPLVREAERLFMDSLSYTREQFKKFQNDCYVADCAVRLSRLYAWIGDSTKFQLYTDMMFRLSKRIPGYPLLDRVNEISLALHSANRMDQSTELYHRYLHNALLLPDIAIADLDKLDQKSNNIDVTLTQSFVKIRQLAEQNKIQAVKSYLNASIRACERCDRMEYFADVLKILSMLSDRQVDFQGLSPICDQSIRIMLSHTKTNPEVLQAFRVKQADLLFHHAVTQLPMGSMQQKVALSEALREFKHDLDLEISKRSALFTVADARYRVARIYALQGDSKNFNATWSQALREYRHTGAKDILASKLKALDEYWRLSGHGNEASKAK